MRKADFFLHSPFSLSLTAKEENKVLLLQFILSDLFSAFHFNKENSFDLIFSPEPFFYPYDWSLRIGYLNKIQEHSVLLSQAFELLEEPLILFNQALEKAISRCRIPNVIQKLVLGNAGATDLQQAMPVPKQGMCKHMSDAGGCKDGDASAAQNQFLNHVRYNGISEDLSVLFSSLFPFLESHRHNENLLFFLLKNQKEISEMVPSETCKGILLKLHPEGLEAIKKLITENYQKRGFTAILNEIKFLFNELEKIHVVSKKT